MLKKLFFAISFIAISITGFGQEVCSSTSRVPYEWPSHRNWFIAPNLFSGSIVNMQTSAVTAAGDAFNPVRSYEAVSAASDDQGNLLFYTNGRSLWKGVGAAVTETYNGLLTGNESGIANGSASQGVITLRHPLDPERYWILTTDDALAGTSGLNAFSFDKNGNNLSGPLRLGAFRTSEGISATFHENGVDIWVTVLESGTGFFSTFLLKCDGFDTTPVRSAGPTVSGNRERGGVAFSWDGEYFAQAHPNFWPDGDKIVSIYRFNKATGALFDAKNVSGAWGSPYDITWSPDNSRVFVSMQQGQLHYLDITSWDVATMRASWTSTGVATAFASIEVGPAGDLFLAHGVAGGGFLKKLNGNLNSGTAFSTSNVAGTSGQSHLGLPTMFLPPAEEPDIEEVGPYCDTDPPVDLNTIWICTGLDAEDPTENPLAYSGTGITDRANGIFSPSVAGVGIHEIIFEYCNVNDTIWIEVNPCPTCEVELDDVTTEICVGETVLLDPFVINGSAEGVWTIDSMPAGVSPVITEGTDTVFDATNLSVSDGVYKLIFTVTDGGEECYDSIYITVNPLPTPDLGADQEICFGDAAVTFDAGSYDNYLWNTTETTQTISTDVDGEYIVTVTDANGCEANDTVVLTVNPLPTPDLGADQVICEGDAAVTFDAGSYDTYLWNTTETTQTISTDVDGEYIVTVTDANGCEANDTVVLTVNPLPTPDLGADQVICAGDAAVTFDAGSYDTYLWNTTEATQTISTDVDGEYIVTVTDANGCEGNDTLVLTVNPLPTPDLGADQVICVGDAAVIFDAGSYDSYLWNTTETTQTISTDVDGEYIVTVTDANGCEANDTVVLTVNPLPTPDLGADQVICEGDAAVTFDGGSYDSYLWNTTETTQAISTDVDDEYIVTVTDANGCEANDTVVLTVNPLPAPDLGADQVICAGDAAVTFDAGSYDSYLWNTTETTQTISTDVDDEYIVTVTDANGCEANDTALLTVNPLPTPDLGADQEICLGDAAIVFDAGAFDSYLWQPNGEITQTISTNVDGEYIVTVTDVNGCEANDTVVLTVNPLPTPDLGADQVICEGDAAVVFDAGAFDNYLWQPNGETTQAISTDVDGEYIVTVTDVNGCEANDTVVLTVNSLPTPNLGADQEICIGDAAVTFDAGAFDSYLWQPNGETTQAINTDIDGEYIVTVVDANGCEANDTVVLTVNTLPIPDLGADQEICLGDAAVTFDAGAFDNYLWQPNGETTQAINTDADGEYIVTVTDANGCEANDTVVLTVNSLPTPDLGADQVICEEDAAVIFDAGTFTSYLWSTTETTQTINTDVDGEYIVTVTDINGCEANDTVVLTVNPLPAPDLGPDVEICAGGLGIKFGLTGFSAYNWSTASTADTITVNTAGIYSVEVTDVNGCINSDTVELVVNTLPDVDLGSDVTICPGSSVTIDAGVGFSNYIWSNASMAQTVTVDETNAGSFNVLVIDANNCAARDTVLITVASSLTVDLGPDTAFCDGNSIELSTNLIPNATYLWGPNGETTPTLTVSQTGTYSLVVTDPQGCIGTDTIEITVNPNPVLDLGADVSLCPTFDTVFTTGTNWSSVVWQDGSTAQTLAANTAGTYYADVTDVNGCAATDTVLLSYFDTARVDLGADITICPGTSATFDAGTFASYTWQNNSTTSAYTGTMAELVYVAVSDANGCLASDTAEIFMATSLPIDLGNDTAVCDGETVTLDAGYPATGYTFSWNTGETTPTINVTTSGIYGVEVQDVTGCSGSDSIVVTVNPNPVLDLGADVSLCPTFDTVFTTGTNWSSILWQDGSTASTLAVNTAGTYYADVTDFNGCAATDTVLLSYFDTAKVDLGADITICPGTSATFDAGTFASYTWHDGSTQALYTSTIAELVTVSVVDANGCRAEDVADIFMASSLPIDLGNDTAVCDGETVTLDAGYPATGYTFRWNTGETTPTINVTTSGIYGVEVQDVTGCSGSDSVIVTVNANPVLDLGPDVSICAGDDTLFTVGLNNGDNWNTILWVDNSTNQTLAVNATGEYTAVVTDMNGCTANDAVNLVVNDNPTLDLGDPVEVCPGISNEFTAIPNAFSSYTWNDGSTAPSFTTNTPGRVWLDVIDANGCVATDTTELLNLPGLDVSLPADTAICDGESVVLQDASFDPQTHTFDWGGGITDASLTVTQSGTYGVFISNGGGCAGYDEIDVVVNSNPTPIVNDTSVCAGEQAIMQTTTYQSYLWSNGATSRVIPVTNADNYEVTVVDINGCTGTGSGTFTVNANPVIPPYTAPTACEGTSVVLNPTLPLGTYLWKDTNVTASSLTVTTAGNYEVVVTDQNGCKDSTIITPTFNANPVLDFGPDQIICERETAVIGMPSGAGTIIWENGPTVADSLQIQETGIYRATLTDVNGCVDRDTVSVLVSYNPKPVATEDTIVCMQEIGELALTVQTGVRDQVMWSTADLRDILAINQNELLIDEEQTYIVTAINGDGCIGRDTTIVKRKCVSSLFVPNAFTPNDDGINDMFGPIAKNIYDYEFYIFNRWGEQIFVSSSLDDQWDGTYMGNLVQIDVYVWKVVYRVEEEHGGFSRQQQVGTVTVIR